MLEEYTKLYESNLRLYNFYEGFSNLASKTDLGHNLGEYEDSSKMNPDSCLAHKSEEF